MSSSDSSNFQTTGPWSHSEIINYLDSISIPIRLSVVLPSGWPIIVSLWFILEGEKLWLATPKTAHIVKALLETDRCAFEVSSDKPPYQGVRGRGIIKVHDNEGERILHSVIDKYLASRETSLARWLLARSSAEVAISIDPVKVFSWDFTERMRSDSY